MNLDKSEVKTFRVTNEDKLMARTKTSILLTEFVRYNPDYEWLSALDLEIKWVVIGEYGTGESNGKKFKGLKQIK